jgi:hypothetical protein
MSKCCAYHWSRSPAGIFFGYQRSTKPGSDQLAVPTRIFPVSILPENLLVTHQRSHTRRRTQIGSLFHLAAVEQMLFRFAQHRYRNYRRNAGWSSLVARQAHNLKAAGSNPAPATKFFTASGALSIGRMTAGPSRNALVIEIRVFYAALWSTTMSAKSSCLALVASGSIAAS